MDQVKESNPKDAIAINKLPVHLVPPSLIVYAAIGFAEGGFKYGPYNWRVAGVRSSVYYSALMRHLTKWWNGEDRDLHTRVPHLANAISCLGILVDAESQGMLSDDRPVMQPGYSEIVDQAAKLIEELRELFKDHNPSNYTQEYMNGRKGQESWEQWAGIAPAPGKGGSSGQERIETPGPGSFDARRTDRPVPQRTP